VVQRVHRQCDHAPRLIAEQDNGTWSLIAVVAEWRLLVFGALTIAVTLRVWRTRHGGEWNALTVGAMLP